MRQSLLLEVKKITSDFLPRTASMLEEVLGRVHNDIKEEDKNCRDKVLELKEAYASLLELGKHVTGQGGGQEEGHEGQEEGHEGQQNWQCRNAYSGAMQRDLTSCSESPHDRLCVDSV